MTRFLVIKTFLNLTKAFKKNPTTKQNLNKRKTNKYKTHLPLASSLLLFCCPLMLVLLPSLSFSCAPKSGCPHMSHHAMKI
jgi:hypothetical protein